MRAFKNHPLMIVNNFVWGLCFIQLVTGAPLWVKIIACAIGALLGALVWTKGCKK